eukprot:3790903-Pleurochrysis_carterae.AAC.1
MTKPRELSLQTDAMHHKAEPVAADPRSEGVPDLGMCQAVGNSEQLHLADPNYSESQQSKAALSTAAIPADEYHAEGCASRWKAER